MVVSIFSNEKAHDIAKNHLAKGIARDWADIHQRNLEYARRHPEACPEWWLDMYGDEL